MPPSPFLTAMRELGQFFGSKIDSLKDAIVVAQNGEKIQSAVDSQTRVLSAMTARIESALEKLRQIEVSSDVVVDTSVIEGDVRSIQKDIQKLKIPDVTSIEAALKMIHDAVKDNGKEVRNALESLLEATAAFSVKVPDVFKLDKQQLMAITGSSRMSMVSGQQTATKITANNTTLTNANTEYSYTFPHGTLSWSIRARAVNAPILYAWATGKLPTSGDASEYFTIHSNFLRSSENVDYSGKTIYLQAGAAGVIVEIESHQL